MPVFDKSTDYLALTQSLNKSMKELQSNLEFESQEYLQKLELFVSSEKKLSKEIEANGANLLRRRNEKLSRKQLKKFISIHPNVPQGKQGLDSFVPMKRDPEVVQVDGREQLHAGFTDFNQRLNFAETSPLHGKFPSAKDTKAQITQNFQKPSEIPLCIAERS